MRPRWILVALLVVIVCESLGLVVASGRIKSIRAELLRVAPPFAFANLGHGFWTMETQSINPAGFWEGIRHSTGLWWRNTFLGEPDWVSVAPSGRHVAFSEGAEVYVFSEGGTDIDTLLHRLMVGREFMLPSQTDLQWEESAGRVVLIAREGRPEGVLQLTPDTRPR